MIPFFSSANFSAEMLRHAGCLHALFICLRLGVSRYVARFVCGICLLLSNSCILTSIGRSSTMFIIFRVFYQHTLDFSTTRTHLPVTITLEVQSRSCCRTKMRDQAASFLPYHSVAPFASTRAAPCIWSHRRSEPLDVTRS